MSVRLSVAAWWMMMLGAVRADITTVAHPGQSLESARTVVWSPLFQASWDKLNARLDGPPLRVEPPNKLMAALDSFRWEPGKVMPEGSWKAWCGPATRDFLKQVNAEASAITGEQAGPFTLMEESEASLAFFGILDRQVEFQRSFFRSVKAPMNFRTKDAEHPVRFFGVRDESSEDFSSAVRVLAWRPLDGSHAIQIRCRQADDSVILYLPPRDQDFATACRWIRTWRSQFKPDAASARAWNDKLIHRNDEIQIPYVSLESKADLAPLLGGSRYHRKSTVPWLVSRAEQLTRFQLHEKGARVRVEVSGMADPFGEAPLVVPRRFLYNRPFFVFLWRDQAEWPYFGAWIGDESALEPFR
ncbi:MAG: hypothetical protein V4584_07195 [Verrucomicrobiota bacterium]